MDILDESGNNHGKSVSAGRRGLFQVALTRVILPIPILLIPPFVLDYLRSTKSLGAAMQRSKFTRTGVELVVIGMFLQFALPLAVAIFPQQATHPASSLEGQFHNRVNPTTGAIVSQFYSNKGI